MFDCYLLVHIHVCDLFVVFEYLTERYFLDLNTRMVEESKQAVSIGPSLSSSAHKTAQRALYGNGSLARTDQSDTELHSSNSKTNRQNIRSSSALDGRRKEKCLVA